MTTFAILFVTKVNFQKKQLSIIFSFYSIFVLHTISYGQEDEVSIGYSQTLNMLNTGKFELNSSSGADGTSEKFFFRLVGLGYEGLKAVSAEVQDASPEIFLWPSSFLLTLIMWCLVFLISLDILTSTRKDFREGFLASTFLIILAPVCVVNFSNGFGASFTGTLFAVSIWFRFKFIQEFHNCTDLTIVAKIWKHGSFLALFCAIISRPDAIFAGILMLIFTARNSPRELKRKLITVDVIVISAGFFLYFITHLIEFGYLIPTSVMYKKSSLYSLFGAVKEPYEILFLVSQGFLLWGWISVFALLLLSKRRCLTSIESGMQGEHLPLICHGGGGGQRKILTLNYAIIFFLLIMIIFHAIALNSGVTNSDLAIGRYLFPLYLVSVLQIPWTDQFSKKQESKRLLTLKRENTTKHILWTSFVFLLVLKLGDYGNFSLVQSFVPLLTLILFLVFLSKLTPSKAIATLLVGMQSIYLLFVFAPIINERHPYFFNRQISSPINLYLEQGRMTRELFQTRVRLGTGEQGTFTLGAYPMNVVDLKGYSNREVAMSKFCNIAENARINPQVIESLAPEVIWIHEGLTIPWQQNEHFLVSLLVHATSRYSYYEMRYILNNYDIYELSYSDRELENLLTVQTTRTSDAKFLRYLVRKDLNLANLLETKSNWREKFLRRDLSNLKELVIKKNPVVLERC